MPFAPVEEQLAIIRRGVDQIVPEDELAQKLQHSRDTDTPLRIKYGIDPTGIDVHLGHTVPLRKMRQFQELGHTAVLIIGNYTALVGDPSGRDEARASRLTLEQIEENATDYLTQCGKVIDLDTAEVIKRLVLDHDVLAIPGTAFTPDDRDGIRFSFANLDADELQELGRRLEELSV